MIRTDDLNQLCGAGRKVLEANDDFERRSAEKELDALLTRIEMFIKQRSESKRSRDPRPSSNTVRNER